MLTLVAAMAGLRAVREQTGLEPVIKWPNDLVLNGKKACGILTEMKLEEGEIRQVVVGMGFNTGQDHFDGELAEKATSLYMETGKKYSRAELCCLVMKHFGQYYREFEKTWDLSFLTEEYNACLAGIGKEVRILTPAGDWIGTSLGIDRTGALRVRDAEGTVQEITAGEVSVRGLYGYV